MSLFDSYVLTDLPLHNRIVMAPMTRARTEQPGNIPNAMMAKYYSQRASAGLIVTEATQISPQGQGYSFTPGIHSDAQIKGWRLVTDAVHAEGGKIFLQLWHVGRMSHSSFHPDGHPVAPSALSPEASVWIADEQGGSMHECPVPRALATDEIPQIVEGYRQAALNAVEAGFDGVEIHAANGYLIDQFLRSTSNQRTDRYGGSRENRMRFVVEIMEAVSDAIGASRTGIRLAPYITARGMNCPDIIPTILEVASHANQLGLVYLHLAEADWDDAPTVDDDFRHQLRMGFENAIIVAGKYDQPKAERLIARGLVDLVAFGRPFIANPDYVSRLQNRWSLAEFDPQTLFGGGEAGYIDYPFYGGE